MRNFCLNPYCNGMLILLIPMRNIKAIHLEVSILIVMEC